MTLPSTSKRRTLLQCFALLLIVSFAIPADVQGFQEAEPKKTESKKTESKKTESKKTESKKTESKKTESKKTESKKADPKKAEPKKTDEKPAEVDPFAVPEGDAEELLAFVNKTMQIRKRFRNITELRTFLTKANAAIEEAVGKILADKSADEETVTKAVAARFAMLSRSVRFDGSALKATADFLKSLEGDKREGIVAEVNKQQMTLRINSVATASDEENEKLLDDLDQWLEEQKLGRAQLSLAVRTARALESAQKMKLAAAAYKRFAARFRQSDDADLAEYGEKLEGAARRVMLMGNPIQVTGTTLAGEKFDWTPYKGKVVLVDFWATWCGPCIAELPNVLKNYELYHDRGFEVVGVSLDKSQERVEAFIEKHEIPWVTLYGQDEESVGWNHPLAVHYGISAIPTVILTDKSGNVVSLRARGAELGRLLEKLLGPADVEEDAPKSKESKETTAQEQR